MNDMWSMLFFALLAGGIYYIMIRVDVLDKWSVICVPNLCCFSHMQEVGSNIAIGLYILDMWSVLFVMYVGGMFKYSD